VGAFDQPSWGEPTLLQKQHRVLFLLRVILQEMGILERSLLIGVVGSAKHNGRRYLQGEVGLGGLLHQGTGWSGRKNRLEGPGSAWKPTAREKPAPGKAALTWFPGQVAREQLALQGFRQA
jgi:hypothetical protein